MKDLLRRLIANPRWGGTGSSRLEAKRNRLLRKAVLLDDEIRRQGAARTAVPEIIAYDRKEKLGVAVCEAQPPWANIPLHQHLYVPGMVTPEERQYYDYLSSFYSGVGEVVELGPWLGLSTLAIVHGLIRNPFFAGRKLHVFDDFVWRSSWMDKWLDGTDSAILRPPNHGDFLSLFERHTRDIREHLVVERRRIAPYDGNEGVPALVWEAGRIELLIVDCGRTHEVNEAWFRTLSPFFIPGRSLLVMEDWRTHREVPVGWYNQTKQFTESKGATLQLIHELRGGSAATFLFVGPDR